MSENTAIQWTDSTWNPWHGCHKVSAGCKNCYMFSEKRRYGQDPDRVVRSKTTFDAPLKWPQAPRLCFTCSWSDWLIEEADPWRDEAYGIIMRTPWITYQILTKRIERAVGRVPYPPYRNIWLGVTVENRATLHRIDLLRRTPAEVRFLSLEPLLEDLGEIDLQGIDWVIAGGESGSGARPPHPDWFRNLRDQCAAASVPFFFKQWGEYHPADQFAIAKGLNGAHGYIDHQLMLRVGKKQAGRLLDGAEYSEFPGCSATGLAASRVRAQDEAATTGE